MMDLVYVLVFIWATREKPLDQNVGVFVYADATTCMRKEIALVEGCKIQSKYSTCRAECVGSREVEKP
jgi:hypothetical protein